MRKFVSFSLTLLALVFAGFVYTTMAVDQNPKPGTWRGQSVTEFDAADNEKFGWQIVNDGVMGGLSKGKVEFTDAGTMKFSGTLSLENNGGFSTVRSADVELNLSNDLGLLLLVKGDGRTYEARLDSDARFRGNPVSFAGEFKTTEGKWEQVKIPFSEFKGSFRGTDLPDAKLNPSMIGRVGILLADKQSGPFDLEIDWIRTYGKGQGKFTERKSEPKLEEGSPSGKEGRQLIATAVADGRFETLKAALDAAGLTTFFQWDNPLTVFAPTDEAFARLPEGVLEDLLKPENKQKLISILSYHVSAGANDLASSLKAEEVKTVQGTPLEIAFSEGRVRVNGAAVLDADVECSDGLIHVIDSVLLPPEPEKPKRTTVLSVAEKAGSFPTLLAAIKAADLESVLEGKGPFTVFAPTEEAFASLPKGTVKSLLQKENRKALAALLTYHVVSGRVSAGDALKAGEAKSVQGDALKFGVREGLLKVNDSTIRTIDLEGGNGVIHVIDSVLLPPSISAKAQVSQGRKVADASETIVAAIEKGVPLYNSGNSKGCADVYQDCIVKLAANDGIDNHARRMLSKVLESGRRHHSADDRAWLYRRSLDGMMAYLVGEVN